MFRVKVPKVYNSCKFINCLCGVLQKTKKINALEIINYAFVKKKLIVLCENN